MIYEDDVDRKTGKPQPRNLTDMSVFELTEYKEDLMAEMTRVDTEINKKSAHKDAVDSLCKPKGE